ncbi:MAG TPA: DUF2730 family protein [Aliidongia sp.]|nr:DUF2730 family protein [Aliidongia sp.]
MNLANIHDWAAIVPILAGLIGIGSFVGRLYLRNGYATKADLSDTKRSLLALGKRTEALEAQLAGVATREDVNRVLMAVERADGDRRALAAEVGGIRDLVARIEKPLDLIQEHLLRDRS